MSENWREIIEQILADPVPLNLRWTEVIASLKSAGYRIGEMDNGTRYQVTKKVIAAVLHRLPDLKTMDRGSVLALRKFLSQTGMKKGRK